ncbi:MAG: hypothetical protein P4K94_08105 [Terracidiphilus sp.]|nr:hypothetical protein [Terracidiphilus sp.]
MYKRTVDSVLAELILAVSLPVLAFITILAKLGSALRRALRRKRMSRGHYELHNLQFTGGGGKHAIEAYEELIDATLAGRRA